MDHAHLVPLSSLRYRPLHVLHQRLTARTEDRTPKRPARSPGSAQSRRRPGDHRGDVRQFSSAPVRDSLT